MIVDSTAASPSAATPMTTEKTRNTAVAVKSVRIGASTTAKAAGFISMLRKTVTATESRALGKQPNKKKRKLQGRRRKSDDDADDTEADEHDSDLGELSDTDDGTPSSDPRAAALARAAARSASIGKAASTRGGFIINSTLGDEGRLPHLTGRISYKQYAVEAGKSVALVLPALEAFNRELATPIAALATAGVMATEVDTIIREIGAWDKSGVVFGRVLSIVAIGRVTDDGDKGAHGEGETSAIVMEGDDDENALAAYANSTKDSTSRSATSLAAPWHIVTLRLDRKMTKLQGRSDPCVPTEKQGRALLDTPEDTASQTVVSDTSAAKASEVNAHVAVGESAAHAPTRARRERLTVAEATAVADATVSSGGRAPQPLSGPDVSVLWLPATDSRVECPFLLTAAAYVSAVERDLRPGTQVRALLPIDAANPTSGEWIEGRVYSNQARKLEKELGWSRSPFCAIRVLWYEQDASLSHWYIDTMQTNNELSPWELSTERQPFVRVDDVRAFCADVPVLTCPRDVVAYLMATEAAGPFKTPVSRKEVQYYARISNPMDFEQMQSRAESGDYDKDVNILWDDLRLLVTNAKTFNQPEVRSPRMRPTLTRMRQHHHLATPVLPRPPPMSTALRMASC